jgi:hypothetical protein
MEKHPIYPERVRTIPKQFSWIDHRLVQHRHIDRLSHRAAALYLFLVTVADARGLSYWSDRSLFGRLGMDEAEFRSARRQLVETGLVAYKQPLYQVMPLDAWRQTVFTVPGKPGEPQSIGKILRRIGEGAP